MSRRSIVAVVFCAAFAAGCASENGGGAEPRPAEAATTEIAETRPDAAKAEKPEERNKRLVRLESACDQWFVATQRQEYDKQASMANLLRTYVGDNYEAVVSDLRFGSPRHRRTMAAALGFSEKPEAVGPLTEALKDQYYEVVLHSLLSLYHLAKADPVPFGVGGNAPKNANSAAAKVAIDPELIAPYLRHPRAEVRSNAAMVLSKVLGPGTSKSILLTVVSAVEDSDAAVRVHAVSALGATGDKEVFPYVVKALHDPVQLVRIKAALALGRLKEGDGAPYLIACLGADKENLDVKRACAKSLAEITGDTSTDSLDAKVWTEIAKSKNLIPADAK